MYISTEYKELQLLQYLLNTNNKINTSNSLNENR